MTAAGAGASMVFIGAELIADGGNPVAGVVVVGLTGFLAAVLIAGFLTFLSRVFEKSSGRRLFQETPPSAGSETAQRLAAADLAGQFPQASHEPGHTAEAARSRLPRPPLASSRLPHRWHPLGRRYAISYPARPDPAARRTGAMRDKVRMRVPAKTSSAF